MKIGPNDLYELLQVHPKADAAAVEAAYARLMEQYDPVRMSGVADEIVQLALAKRAALTEARATLLDPARRAAHDAVLAAAATDAAIAAATPNETANAPPATILDYRPLPRAGRAERQRGFADQPTTARRTSLRITPTIVGLVVAVGMLLPALISGLLITGTGQTPRPAPTSTPAPETQASDAAEVAIEQARQKAEGSPNDAQAWIDYGNMLYDSAQVVRENAPNSVLYQQRLPRWLDAMSAYQRALTLKPGNPEVQGDLGASSCFYGIGASDSSYIEKGIEATARALEQAPDQPRVLLNRGFCLVSAQPPRNAEAIKGWQRILTLVPTESPLAGQAKALIDQYGK